MTLRRAFLVLSLVALAAPAAASSSQSALPSPASAPTTTPAQSEPAPAVQASPSTTAIPVDPSAIAFDASADHDAEDFAGPKLLKYVIEFVPVVGAPGTAYTLDLGKPKPVQSQIVVPLSKVLLPGTYLAHVRAIGRGLKSSASTVGPFSITEKTGKTKAEFDKEMRERQEAERRQERQNKKLKVPHAQPVPPPDADSQKDSKEKDTSKPAKGGFWKKFYEKVVG